jgi:polyhydroxyalkanoate synthesis regulator phasin
MITDVLKKGVLAGIGAAIVTKESADRALNELVEKGRLSAEEARQTADRLVEEGRKELDKTKTDINVTVEDAMKKANLVTRSDLEALKADLDALRVRVALLEGPATAAERQSATDEPTTGPVV